MGDITMGRVSSITVFLLVAAATTASCSSGSGMPHTWIGGDSSDAYLLQMTRSKSALTGSMDATELTGADSTTTKNQHYSFTGKIDGTAITLTFGGIFVGTNFAGTLDGDTLKLQFPQGDGTVQTVAMHPGSVGDYNKAASGLGTQADTNQSNAESAEARLVAQQSVDSDATRIASDVGTLQTALGKKLDVSGFDSDIQTAKDDLQTQQHDLRQAGKEADRGSACSDAGSAQSDAGSVESDSGSIDSDAAGVDSTITELNGDVQTLADDFKRYQSDRAALPDYTPAIAPDVALITSLKAQASKTISRWKATVADYKSQVKQLLDRANRIAKAAQAKYCV